MRQVTGESFVDDDGLWCQPVTAGAPGRFRARPALFLDRDGVIVEEVGYLHRPEDVRLIPGAAAPIRAANRAGVPVVVLTNQSGIGRGLYGWAEFARTQAQILADLAAAGARPDLVLACPYHPEGRPPYRHPDHPARKPRPGMILRAGERLELDLARSWIVGDRAIDLRAGRAAGMAGGLLVLTGYGREQRAGALALAGPEFEVRIGEAVPAAAVLVPLLQAPAR